MRAKLTRDFCRTAATDKPGGQRFHDTDRQGLVLKVHPNGRRVWVAMFRAGGKQRQVVLGEWPKLSPSDAWTACQEVRSATRKGRQPDPKVVGSMLTFESWATRYTERAEHRLKRPDHVRRALTQAIEWWGPRPLGTITPDDVAQAVEQVRQQGAATIEARAAVAREAEDDDKAARLEAHPAPGATSANRWLAQVRACLQAAVKAGHLSSNPAAVVDKLREAPPRARVLTADELKRLAKAIDDDPDPFVRVGFRLMLATGCRAGELRTARWEHFDLDAGTWRLSSPKAGHPQTVVLTPDVVAWLRKAPKADSGWLMPGKLEGRPLESLRGPWARLKAQAKLPADVVLHDVRRTYGLHVAKAAGLHIASKVLRHSDVRITEQVYAPLGVGDLRQALEQAGQVVPFPGGKVEPEAAEGGEK
jgi:integrase